MTVPPKTQELIDRLCRAAYCFEVKKEETEEAVKTLYEFHSLEAPKFEWVKDITDEKLLEASWASWASRASSASRASWASWASLDYDFDYFVGSHEWLQSNKGNEHDEKFLKAMELHLKVKEAGCGYMAEKDGILYLAPNPTLRFNAEFGYHSDQLPAIEWKDGLKCYFLNGVSFPKDLWEKVVSKKMPFQDILAIVDTDQRTQAMKYGNVWDFIKHAKGEELDKYTKFRPDTTEVNYWLYKFPKGDIFTEDAYFCIYDDLVPGSDKQYMSGVTPCKTVAEAMSWKQSDDQYTVTTEEWLALRPGYEMN